MAEMAMSKSKDQNQAARANMDFDVRKNAPLGRVGWFQAGGTAQYLFKANDIDHLKAFLRHSYDAQSCRNQYGDVHVFGV